MQPSLPQAPDPSIPPVPQAAPVTPPVQATRPQHDDAAAQPAAVAPTGPAMADDNDLIEKEWVQQVKRIVSSTAHDPYQLSQQFSQLKADYMQKRYGKTIKSDG